MIPSAIHSLGRFSIVIVIGPQWFQMFYQSVKITLSIFKMKMSVEKCQPVKAMNTVMTMKTITAWNQFKTR